MPGAVNPSVPIMLDKERHLRMDLNAMVSFEEATGKSLFDKEVAAKLGRSMTAGDLRALLWACLLHENKDLTIEQVGSWINGGNMSDIAASIAGAWQAAMPKGDGKPARPLAQKSRTG